MRSMYSVHSRAGSSAYLHIASALIILGIIDFHFWKRLHIALDMLSRSAAAVFMLFCPFMYFMGNGLKSTSILPKCSSFMHFFPEILHSCFAKCCVYNFLETDAMFTD